MHRQLRRPFCSTGGRLTGRFSAIRSVVKKKYSSKIYRPTRPAAAGPGGLNYANICVLFDPAFGCYTAINACEKYCEKAETRRSPQKTHSYQMWVLGIIPIHISCAKFRLFALIVFGWQGPENLMFPFT